MPIEEFTSAQLLKAAAQEAGVTLEILDDENKIMLFKKHGVEKIVKNFVPELNSYVASKISDDKNSVKKILKKYNLPTPQGLTLTKPEAALKALAQGKIKFPVVVKPVQGSQGAAVAVAITQTEWLIRAIKEVFKYNRQKFGEPGPFIIEKYIPGQDYRFLVLDQKVLTVLRREPAYVIGDGQKTIVQLIDQYNSLPGVGPHLPLCPIAKDHELDHNLQKLNLSLVSQPEKGKKIVLRKNANISTGGRSFECTDLVHRQYKKLAVHVANLLHLRFCAVDLISPNISRFEKYALIEVNDTPGFDIHEFPYRGRPCPVSKYLIEAMFKN